MLDTATKRRIDTARDILVGKVPDPKSQVEQITIALIYKFMDDMDAEAEEFGGRRNFFAGEYARYGWAKLMRSGLGGHEMLNLYAEAIAKMPENPGIPLLFREIFKNAYLPYRNPETLRAFLKIIDEFEYDHSERLGDAFEYLLSVLGSQGEAGQFRTPRHIIDFIAEIVGPKKDETILDPACGTAGFLISSYKHILKTNTDKDGNCTLTPDERGRLAANLKGYDISPDMVRLSLVNMYLHGFASPQIYEYDTLTSLDRWNEYADVILANPPFMSPKGGIKPHNRFSVKSKRSEVLFVDYMAEHLTPKGRAGIIVPEGIIFQSQTAYKQLRKMLVEDYLVAVVSLPAGVFNPYSGVKTSILILDKALAKQANTIAFFKIENDGFGLGAQRRPIDKNDLPQAISEIAEYLGRLRAREPVLPSPPGKGCGGEGFQPTLGIIVPKDKIAANGEYNLGGERYRENGSRTARFPYVKLATIADITAGNAAPQGEEYFVGGKTLFVRTSDVGKVHLSPSFSTAADRVNQTAIDELRLRLFPAGTILFPKSGASTFLNHRVVLSVPAYVSSHLACITCDKKRALPQYLYQLLCYVDAHEITPDQAYPSLRLSEIGNIEIPLPPPEVQKEIVEEIEGYQKVIDGARAVIDNYRPHIPVDPAWPLVELGTDSIFRIESGGTPKSNVPEYWGGCIAWATLVDLPAENFVSEIRSTERTIAELGLKESSAKLLPENSVIVSTRATIGRIAINRVALATNQGFKNVIIKDHSRALSEYVAFALTNLVPQMQSWATGGTFKELSKSKFCELCIPLPSLSIQQAIVAEIKSEQVLVNANRELIARMEKKIQATLDRIWGKDGASSAEEESVEEVTERRS